MEIKLNHIFNIMCDEIKHCKIELNTHATNNNDLYIDDWITLSAEEKEAGEIKHSFYLWHDHEEKNQSKYNVGELVFSFFNVNNSKSEWLLVSAAKITEIPKDKEAFKPKYEIVEKYKPFFGRLIIKCQRSAPRVYCYTAETIIDKCVVKEILPNLYENI